MARISHLIRRVATYFARIRAPLDLVEIVGKKELVKLLGASGKGDQLLTGPRDSFMVAATTRLRDLCEELIKALMTANVLPEDRREDVE